MAAAAHEERAAAARRALRFGAGPVVPPAGGTITGNLASGWSGQWNAVLVGFAEITSGGKTPVTETLSSSPWTCPAGVYSVQVKNADGTGRWHDIATAA